MGGLMVRRLDASAFAARGAINAGAVPHLDWIDIAKLVIDETYQRPIGKKGATTIRKIIANFLWSKFSPVIVAPIAGGLFAIIDGQHRATAAGACGFTSVPCQIVVADPAEQAAAFAAVNGAVTAMTSLQLYHARVAAGDEWALQLQKICEATDVVICRYPIAEKFMKPGETLAPKVLERNLVRYGEATLTAALKCITRTSNNASGMVRASVVSGLCDVLNRMPAWRDAENALLAAMEEFDLEGVFDRIVASGGGGHGARLADAVALHLNNRGVRSPQPTAALPVALPPPKKAIATAPPSGIPFRPAARRAAQIPDGPKDASTLVFDDPPPGRSALDQKRAAP
jgi:hypothetical protein